MSTPGVAALRLPVLPTAPRTRGECSGGPRPCPWTHCRHHIEPSRPLARDRAVVPTSGATCALDEAERGGMTLQEIGAAMGRTRERIRQIEAKGLANLARELERLGVLADTGAAALKRVRRVVLELRT